MLLLPAIDIKNGQCVRLYQGKKDEVTVYSDDPVEVARVWERMGALMLHLVDLDAAFTGELKNLSIIKKIVDEISIPVQVGGGIRSQEAIEKVLDLGVKRVILGTIALKEPELVKKAVEKYPERIVVGIDSKDGYVAVEGWEAKTSKKALEFALEMKELGVERIVFTDTSKDGTLKGPNFEATKEIAEKTSLKVIAAGGFSSLDDIRKIITLKPFGVEGAILGKSLYTGNINLDDALSLVKESL